MQIDVRITYNGKEINAEAILDSGAEGIYCNTSFIKKYSLPTYDIELPIYPRNVMVRSLCLLVVLVLEFLDRGISRIGSRPDVSIRKTS